MRIVSLQKFKTMKKSILLALFAVPLFFNSCEAPNVVNGNAKKEIANRKIRHISHEDEEVFGIIFSEEKLDNLLSGGINQQQIDSVNQLEGISIEFITNENIVNREQYLIEQMEMYAYELDKGHELVSNGNYNKTRPVYYYSTKAVLKENKLTGFWLLKFDAPTVRRNMPEQ